MVHRHYIKPERRTAWLNMAQFCPPIVQREKHRSMKIYFSSPSLTFINRALCTSYQEKILDSKIKCNLTFLMYLIENKIASTMR